MHGETMKHGVNCSGCYFAYF